MPSTTDGYHARGPRRRRPTLAALIVLSGLAGCAGEAVPSSAPNPVVTRGVAAEAPAEERPTCQGTPTDLLDENYPAAVAGDDRYRYHKTARDDLDGDGQAETVHVIAQAVKDGSGYSWDDGSPWHVYVEEVTGERTYLYSGWVQLGVLEVAVIWRDGPGSDLLVQHEAGAGFILYCAEYRGPGRTRATEITEFAVTQRVAEDG